MNEKEIKDDFLTVNEAARYLKVSRPKLYQLRATERDFPFHKIGKSLRFCKEELKQWVLSR